MQAAENGYLDVIEFLINQGVDVNLSNQDGTTALMIAALNDHKEIFEILQKANTNDNMVNKKGTLECTPCSRQE